MKLSHLCCLFAFWPSLVWCEPLSAIDWLNEKRSQAFNATSLYLGKDAPEQNIIQNDIEVSPLAEMRLDAVGLLSPHMTGLPVTLWQESRSEDLIKSLDDLDWLSNPILQSLLFQLMLAEGYAPSQSEDDHSFLRARL